MDIDRPIVIVGAGLAGAKAAETLREQGFTGRVVLIGAEAERPYERPGLSKGYLLGDDDRAALFVHDENWYTRFSVELRLGRRATRLDRDAHTVRLDDGEDVEYGRLLLTTGASPRALPVPGAELDGVFRLRRLTDSDRLRAALRAGGRVVVVGAGWIGLETAAAARTLGCEVTVLEPASTVLGAALGAEMGDHFADLHRRHGVDLRLGHGAERILGDGGRVRAVVADDGAEIAADTVIVGIGARPDTDLAEQAGLAVDDGVLVDASLRTGDPDVFAAGDVANPHHPHYGRRIRVEHWDNALHAGTIAARAMLGEPVVFDRIPFFFTDQYDVGMEYAGWFPRGGYDRVVTRGDVPGQSFQAFWLSGDRVVAGMHVNRWDEGIDPIRALVRGGGPVTAARLADPTVPLAELAAPAR
ncbi:3-phenylpropionate/trans-cinnamate dioxygenase ferredoxin reductase subunit [Stackebrandtia albiflava]|uniref:3-phenylpropionate/trans-cinnamate dioxygenase ferredoxin reductase subunit n=1 Tax=Stackebrandtia albiflava TaxID=406432 RepID=A0A562VE38_9ACTN|nr:FAD-dependent oxidoreductase [Stackebrandtia albiflava]TWJ16150.1 3-phenylpropionate/trans-cinnamate dioxygenase ferredoxin reductase subunit [Stackebrandtia albiflava]